MPATLFEQSSFKISNITHSLTSCAARSETVALISSTFFIRQEIKGICLSVQIDHSDDHYDNSYNFKWIIHQ